MQPDYRAVRRRDIDIHAALLRIAIAMLLLFGALVQAEAHASQVKFSWDYEISGAAGFVLYCGLSSLNYSTRIDVGNTTTYTIGTLTEGATYFCAVTAYDPAKLESSYSNEVGVSVPYSLPTVNFSASPTSGTAPLNVTFSNTTTGKVTTWAWNFGDGTTSNLQSPTHVYSAQGNYNVVLTATGPGGTASKATTTAISVSASAVPVVNFSASPTSGSAPLNVTFSNTTTGQVTAWAWSFGDGTTSNLQSPTHVYSTPGSYNVVLTATGSGGTASKTASTAISVSATAVPVVNFSASPTSGSAPLSVAFANTTTGQVTTWAWNFGDGTTSNLQSPTHVYNAAGSYNVVLTATGPGGTASKTAATAIAVSAASTTSAVGLVAAYGFEEGTGSGVTDLSGKGNTGAISGATWTTAGKFGKALSFNGSSNWVTVNDSPSIDLASGMTLEAWVYPTVAMSGWRCIIVKEAPGYVVNFLYASSNTGKPIGGIFTSAENSLEGGLLLPANAWTHLAATYDGSIQRLYVNGVQVASRAQTGTIRTSGNPLRIGGNSIWNEYFQGRIDEVRIYNRSLSGSEIQADMNAPVVR